jgi:hypothetical protein
MSSSENFNKYRETNRLSEDKCAKDQERIENEKKLKYVTTNYNDLLSAKVDKNFFGIDIREELTAPADKIDVYSSFREGERGNILTNYKSKSTFGQLPFPTMPGKYQISHGDVVTEDGMRNTFLTTNKACNPKGVNYHDRSFYIFDNVETPDASKSVEDPDLFGHRGGVSTRYLDRFSEE